MNRQSYVYFMRDEDTQLIKIGYSKFPSKRQQQIIAKTQHTISLLGCMRGAKTVEKRLHKKFSAYCVRHEWFLSSDEILSFIYENATDELIPIPIRQIKKMNTPKTAQRNIRINENTHNLIESLRDDWQPVGYKYSQGQVVYAALKLLAKRVKRQKDKQS